MGEGGRQVPMQTLQDAIIKNPVDLDYEYINNAEGLQNTLDLAEDTESSQSVRCLQYMEEEEVKIYNYLYETEGKEEAEGYLSYIQGELSMRRALETTKGGSYLDNLHLFEKDSPLTREEATNVWARLSARYASGNTYGFVNGSWMQSIFNIAEYPELLKNPKVTSMLTELMQ